MLKRVWIWGYKSLVGVELTLQPLSVLVGPNAACKSNFLDALQLLSRLATAPTLREAFAPPYRGNPLESFSYGPDGIPGLLGRASAAFAIEVDVELSPRVVARVHRQVQELGASNRANGSRSVPHGQTRIDALASPGPFFKNTEMDDTLEEAEQPLPVSARLLRGDLDA